MPMTDIATYAAIAALAGLLIGCVGIGGVILVPLLAYAGGVAIHTAIAAAMFSYLVSGAIGTWVFARNKSIRWDLTGWMWAGAMPAAFVGALAASVAPGAALELLIGVLTLASGLNALLGPDRSATNDRQSLAPAALLGIGVFTGFLSALTGTGGPLVLVPILIWLDVAVLTAIGLSQAIQLPIAVLATGGNFYAGTLDLTLGVVLACGIAAGTWAGAKLAHVLPTATLRQVVSIIMVLVGGLIIGKLAFAAFA